MHHVNKKYVMCSNTNASCSNIIRPCSTIIYYSKFKAWVKLMHHAIILLHSNCKREREIHICIKVNKCKDTHIA